LKKLNKITGETTANNISNENTNLNVPIMKGATRFKRRGQLLSGLAVFVLLSVPTPALASIENMMGNLQTAILNVLAPMVCVGGIIFSGFKLAMGDESAKRMLFWSCVGTVVAFTAPSILSFLQNRVAS
jgi:type IV secretory pathway VirB2 component (pilin)